MSLFLPEWLGDADLPPCSRATWSLVESVFRGKNGHEAAIDDGLTNHAEIERVLAELSTHEADVRSIQGTAQGFQVIGTFP